MKNRWIASLILTMTIGGILAGCKSEKDKVGGTGEVLTQTLSQQEVQQVMAAGRALPIYCVDTKEKKVGLSFDAAWGNDDTEQILEILKNQDRKSVV